MKTELKIPESKPELKFPLLAKSTITSDVVLFITERTGIVVVCPGPGRGIAYLSTSWDNVLNSSTWTILPPGTQLILTVE